MDLDSGDTTTLRGADLGVDRKTVYFSSTELLTVSRHYNITISASNTAGSSTSYTLLSEYLDCQYVHMVHMYIH